MEILRLKYNWNAAFFMRKNSYATNGIEQPQKSKHELRINYYMGLSAIRGQWNREQKHQRKSNCSLHDITGWLAARTNGFF